MADEAQVSDVQLESELQSPEEAINEEFAAQQLAERLGLHYVDLEHFEIDPELFRSIPVDLMFRYNFVPRHRTENGLVVVVADPTDVLMIDELELLLGTGITVSVGTSSAIQEILKKSESSQRVLEEATEGFRLQIVTEDAETGEETLSIDKMTEGSSPIIKLVDSTIFNALQRRASDMHFETRDKQVVIKYRIDGVLYQAMEPIDKKFHAPIISRLKVMSELDISEKRIPQDGRFKLRIKGRTIDFRVSIVPTAHGEDCVIRVLDKESTSQEFSSLSLEVCGFEDRDKARLRRFIKEPYGMVLVTGPTGSGKTTTLYAALAEITNEEDKIITIEDPVEYQMPGITQIPVNERKGLTFSKGLRAILRHDPDKVMVGEIRDPETAAIAIQSALTGHLVFTTVHANNVVDVVGRFLNMNVEPYNFVSALNCILAQRLVRLICEHCKQPVKATRQQLQESGLDPARFSDWTFYKGRGCIDCNGTGYRGRTAIAELLDMSDRIREMILQRKPGSDIKRAAKEEGMTFLREAALSKAFAGKTTLHEINKVTFVD